jgi:hypothetical protein
MKPTATENSSAANAAASHTPSEVHVIDELDVFIADKSPVNAIRLAISDHKEASKFHDWDFIDALKVAERQCESHGDLLEALRRQESTLFWLVNLEDVPESIRESLQGELEAVRRVIAKAEGRG